jgi:RHS repeat-associated protein
MNAGAWLRWCGVGLGLAVIGIGGAFADTKELRENPNFMFNFAYSSPSPSPWRSSPEAAFADAKAQIENCTVDGTCVTLINFHPGTDTEGYPYNVVENGVHYTYWWTTKTCYSNGTCTTNPGGYIQSQMFCDSADGYGAAVFNFVPNQVNRQVACQKVLPIDPDPPLNSCPTTPKPVYGDTGLKMQREEDFTDPRGLLTFARTWRSDAKRFIHTGENNIVDSAATVPAGIACRQGSYDANSQNSAYCYPALGIVANTTPGSTSPAKVAFNGAEGRTALYADQGSALTPAADINDKLVRSTNAQSQMIWTVTTEDNTVETYRPDGLLDKRQLANGQSVTYTYSTSSTPTSIAPRAGLLIGMADNFGRSISMKYNSAGNLSALTDPAAGVTTYTYDEVSGNCPSSFASGACQRLTSVLYPDGKTRRYHYNETGHIDAGLSNIAAWLTGITDENNIRLSHYHYDAQGRVSSSGWDGHDYTLAYDSNLSSANSITDPLGTIRTYGYSRILNKNRLTGVNQPAGAGCAAAPNAVTYNTTTGNVTSTTDFNQHKTCYAYDSRNLETARVEGLAAADSCSTFLSASTLTLPVRKISTTWHANWRLPLTIAEPNRITTFTYNTNSGTTACATGNPTVNSLPIGVVCQRTEKATTDNTGVLGTAATADSTVALRTSNMTYNNAGQLTGITDPLSHTTTFAYYTTATVDHKIGDLQTVTNAVTLITTYNKYDANGRVTQLTQPNGIVTTLAYWPRGWLKTVTNTSSAGAEVTNYAYDNAGQLQTVTLPDASTIGYTYDNAHRLTDITDILGQKIHYTLDAMGNRLTTEIRDASNTVIQTHGQRIDALNRLKTDVSAYNTVADDQIISYEYDAQGNQTKITQPNGTAGQPNRVTQNVYDVLNRLTQVTDPTSGLAKYEYNGKDQLTKVTDPKTYITTYTVDGLNNIKQIVSPDSGTTANVFDAAGNLTSSTDAANHVTTIAYDNINRPQTITYKNGTTTEQTATFTYHANNTTGAGNISTITDSSGTTTDSYTNGKLTSRAWVTGSNPTLTQLMSYSGTTGQQTGLQYPSGKIITYSYGTDGKINGIQLDGTTTLLVISKYQPFSNTATEAYWSGNASYPKLQVIDQDGRIYAYTKGTQSGSPATFDYYFMEFDNASRLSTVKDGKTAALLSTFGYDTLDRLTSFSGTLYATANTQALAYDANGNRTSGTTNGTSRTYTNSTVTNKLLSLTSPAVTYTYTAAGNLQSDGTNTFYYDARNRLTKVVNATGTFTYTLNALGQRMTKEVKNTSGVVTDYTAFMYNSQGQLIGEYDLKNSKIINEYVWLYDIPVVLIRYDIALNTTKWYAINVDHLGTPRRITDPANSHATVWQWDTLPNGETQLDTASQTFGVNLRLPGQYWDKETGLHYNYFRSTYNPATGRYGEVDPIGLRGGLNPYLYAGGNAVNNIDSFGLNPGTALGAGIGSLVLPGAGTVVGAVVGTAVGIGIGVAIDNSLQQNGLPPGFWPGDRGAEEWGRRNGISPNDARRRFHGIKQGDKGRPRDNYGVNPDTGDVCNPDGDHAGDLGSAKPK